MREKRKGECTMEKLGLQMYSFGEYDPSKVEIHLKTAKEMGYFGVELFGPNLMLPAQELKELLEKYQLEAISMHVQTDMVLDMITYAKALGMSFIGIGMEYLPDGDSAHAYAKRLNELGEVCHQNGMMLTYHNHTQEFMSVGEKRIVDILLENTNPDFVSMELDAGWCAAAGFDPIEFINQYQTRVKLIHIKESKSVIGVQPPMNPKDIKFDASGTPLFSEEEQARMKRSKEINCAAGQGLVNWKALKETADRYGCRAYIVEREHSYSGERIECLQEDINYYKANM